MFFSFFVFSYPITLFSKGFYFCLALKIITLLGWMVWWYRVLHPPRIGLLILMKEVYLKQKALFNNKLDNPRILIVKVGYHNYLV